MILSPEIPVSKPPRRISRVFKYFGFFFLFLMAVSLGFGILHATLVGANQEEEPVATSGSSEERMAMEVSQKQTDNDRVFVENMLPVAEFQPTRKEEVSDLTLPNAHSSLILDAQSGTILHFHNAKDRRQIASLTKMMTALLVLEHVRDLKEPVTITQEMLHVDGTVVGCPRSGYCIDNRFHIGEQIRVEDLLKAMLMNSANDAATALGVYVGGTQEKFVSMMNARAIDLGLKDSNFCTPSGLEIDGKESECYSSAYDIGRIAAQTMKYDVIWEFMRHPQTTIFSIDKQTEHRIITTNELIGQYPNLLGTKTGFTPAAGKTLLAGAEDPQGKHKVVAVVLNDPNRWSDLRTMFDWTFQSYSWQ